MLLEYKFYSIQLHQINQMKETSDVKCCIFEVFEYIFNSLPSPNFDSLDILWSVDKFEILSCPILNCMTLRKSTET